MNSVPGAAFGSQLHDSITGCGKVNYRQTKKEIMARLRAGSADMSGLEERYAVRALLGSVASHDPGVKWLAVSALGECTARMAGRDPESGREILRRIVWGLNEESGAVGLGLPEAMGEILARHEGLRAEFLNLLLNYLCPGHCYLEFPPLNQGVIWALGRVAQVDPAALIARGAADYLTPLLDSQDPQTKGLALWALSNLGHVLSPGERKALGGGNPAFSLFSHGRLTTATIAEFSAQKNPAIRTY